MSRSLKKGPFIAPHLLKKVQAGKAGDQISEQDRLAELLRDQARDPGGANVKSDVANEFVHGEAVRQKKRRLATAQIADRFRVIGALENGSTGG